MSNLSSAATIPKCSMERLVGILRHSSSRVESILARGYISKEIDPKVMKLCDRIINEPKRKRWAV